jgi:O-antigen/teichoic acid export membrane protein
MELSGQAIRGVLWSALEFGGGEGISFVVFLMLARLLAPDDFGVVALAGSAVAFVQLCLAQGFADALIQRREITPEHCSTAFWTNIAVALGFMVVVVMCAGPAAALFHEKQLAPVLWGLSPLFLTSALTSVHLALFRRELRFSSLALRALIGVTAGGVAGIGLAAAGAGLWALVGQQLLNGVVSVAVIWHRSEWRPAWLFSRHCFAEMAHFSATVIGSSLAGFFARRLDTLLVGYVFDARQLGYYYLVQRLLTAVGLVTLSAVQAIVMPVLSRLQDQRDALRDTFVATIELVQSLWLPLVIGIGLVAPLLLPVLLGPRWGPAVPLLQVQCLAGFAVAFSFFTGPVLYAVNRPAVYLRLVLVQIAMLAALILLGARFGLVGVAAAYVAALVLVAPLHLEALRRHAGVAPTQVLRACRPAFLATLVMAGPVLALQAWLADTLPAGLLLALSILAGAAVYVATLRLAAPAHLRRLAALLARALDLRSRPGSAKAAAGLTRHSG